MELIRRLFPAAILAVFFLLFIAPPAPALEVGEKAPDFELPSTKDGKLKLSGFQGKKNLLIQFYVLDFTPT